MNISLEGVCEDVEADKESWWRRCGRVQSSEDEHEL
jgi:hypothetical protein